MRLIVLTCFFGVVGFWALAQNKPYQDVSNSEFRELYAKPNTVILDVRTASEYQSGHIPGAILLNLYDPDFEQKIKTLDKTKSYLVYCRSGMRSSQASYILSQAGFGKIYNLTNGLTNWDGKLEQ